MGYPRSLQTAIGNVVTTYYFWDKKPARNVTSLRPFGIPAKFLRDRQEQITPMPGVHQKLSRGGVSRGI